MASKQILMVLTNHASHEGKPTGWFLAECAHPYHQFVAAGHKVTIASVAGGATTVSPSSLDNLDKDEANSAFWNTEATRNLTSNTPALSSFNGATFDCVFFVGGFGTMWDFPQSADVARVAGEAYAAGKILGGVCHGPIFLANVKASDGSYVVNGKRVTAFTDGEEDAVGYRGALPVHEGLGATCNEVLSARGATFIAGADWSCNVQSDARIFTGQNPMSATAVGKAIVDALAST